MKRCPICRNSFPGDQARFCPVDGAVLEAAPEPSGDPLLGTTIDGKYRIEARLGAGGMGTVYRARHELLGRDVAVKVLRSEMLADPRSAERFRREAQAAARLEHPNAVTIYDFGISSGSSAYLVMELLGGTSLRDLLERDGALPVERTVEIFSKVCAAIDRAHQLGIVHRDLKPDNVMVDERPDGSTAVKVVDFGIAMLQDPGADAGRLTGTGMVVGTANYMSPEHCRGQEVDSRSDIYSLGIVLYEMLTGRVPFEAPVPSAVIVAHVSDPPPPPRLFRPDLPAAVERVVLDALAKQPDARPQTAGELGRRLAEAVAAAPGDATVVVDRAPSLTVPVVSPWTQPELRPGTGAGHLQASTAPSAPPPWPSSPQAAAPPPVAQYEAPPPAAKRRGFSPLAIGLVSLLALAVVVAAVAGAFGIVNWQSRRSQQTAATDPAPSTPTETLVIPVPQPSQPSQPAQPAQPAPSEPGPLDPSARPEGEGPAEPSAPPAGDAAPPAAEPGARPLTADERGQVEQFVADWISSSESKDIEWHMRHYADTVEFYRGGRVPKSRIRADRERAYARFDRLELRVPRIHEATLSADGQTVRLVFDKSWEFVGPSGNSRGRVKQLLVLRRVGGDYRIVLERDLGVY